MNYTLHPLKTIDPSLLPKIAEIQLGDAGLLSKLGYPFVLRYFEIAIKDKRAFGFYAQDNKTGEIMGLSLASPEPSSLTSQLTHDRKWLEYAHEVYTFYRKNMTAKGEILYDIPHGMGTFKQAYGEFITWRACFHYYELTGLKVVKDFLVKALRQVYHFPAKKAFMPGGWGCSDMFPAWALYTLTGEQKVLEDNIPFLKTHMEKQGNFPWGGVDWHFYLAELDRLGILETIVRI